MQKDEEKRNPSYSLDNHVDAKNDFVTAEYPEGMKSADMKMLRFMISQCRKGDREFFEYEFSASDVAEHFNMNKFNLFREARDMTEKRLFNCNLRVGTEDDHELIHLFRKCKYKDGIFTMRMDDEAAKLFLNLRDHFTEIPIAPILAMKNKNSIRIYELLCQRFSGSYPYAAVATSVQITCDELRQVTETADKKSYDHIGHLKEKILNPALAEIEREASWKIITRDIKRGRRIVAIELEVWTAGGYEIVERCKRTGELLPGKYRDQVRGQMSLEDYFI